MTRPTGSPKYGTTRKNTQRYYTTKRLIRYIYSQFLRLRRLCSEDSDFSLNSEEMCEFFDKRGYLTSVVEAGHHRAQQLDRQSALQTSQRENNNRIPFTLTFHPHNHAVKSIILKNFKLLQNDPDTGRIFSQPPLISFKRDKNIGNFLVRSGFQTSEQPGTFKCARARCKTCPFICNVEKLSEPKRSIKITDHFTCTSVGGAVASWLAHSTPEWALRARALAGDIVLCSWARHFTLTVPLSTQVYKWVPANLMLGGNPAMD